MWRPLRAAKSDVMAEMCLSDPDKNNYSQDPGLRIQAA